MEITKVSAIDYGRGYRSCIQGPTNGSRRIPYKDVEDFPELREGEQPFLSVRMDSPGDYEAVVAEAIAAGVAAYFGR